MLDAGIIIMLNNAIRIGGSGAWRLFRGDEWGGAATRETRSRNTGHRHWLDQL